MEAAVMRGAAFPGRGAALRQLSNCKWKREARPPQMERLLSL